MISKIKEKVKNFIAPALTKAAEFVRANKKRLMITAAALTLLGGLAKAVSSLSIVEDETSDHYVLVLIAPNMMPLDQLLITNLTRHIDGSICFTEVRNERQMCFKLQNYALNKILTK
jgi:hypothetical protein